MTLLEDLEQDACYHDAKAAEGEEPASHRRRAAQFREHARRLREECAKARRMLDNGDATRAARYQGATDVDAIERINGGPIAC